MIVLGLCPKTNSHISSVRHLCSGFTKSPMFLNMAMTFVLHPLSHYNSITKPRARFLLSLLKGLTIDFPSHFILSLIDVYKDTTTCDKLIFLQLSRGFSTMHLSPILSLHTYLSCVRNNHSMEQGPASTEMATDRDGNYSGFFHSIHIHSFFCG